MKWLRGSLMRRVADHAFDGIRAEFREEEVAKTISLAFGLACDPNDSYGDDDRMDRMLERIKQCPFTPCDPKTAAAMIKKWKTGSLSAEESFQLIWGMDFDEFVKRLLRNEGIEFGIEQAQEKP